MSHTFPPPYQVRKSKKAKNPQLVMHPIRGLEVVVPYRIRHFCPERFLQTHKAWVQKQAAQLRPREVFPSWISLPGISQTYKVDYVETLNARSRQIITPHHYTLESPTLNWPFVQGKLKAWLKTLALPAFQKLLNELCEEYGFTYQSLKVRGMTTRWGSCDRQGHITLNLHLLFLPQALVRHVLLHELCHTRYMSHGPRFWGLLQKCDPSAIAHNAALKNAQVHVPGWLT